MQVFSKEKFIKDMEISENEINDWVNECDGKEVVNGMCGGSIIHPDWCIEREENKMKFKVGDRVKHETFGIGTVRHIETCDKLPYAVEFDNYNSALHSCCMWTESTIKDEHGYWCDDDDLELAEFTKADLKEYDILTLRDGSKRICGVDDDTLIEYIRDDLTNDGNLGKDLDIVKVERPTYTTVYEREEVKEMTLKEVCDKLGYEIKIIKE